MQEIENKSGYIKTWGRVFSEFGTLGQETCVAKMDELFPGKLDSNHKWATWYKAYYNMGKILGYPNPVKIHWKKAKVEVVQEVQA